MIDKIKTITLFLVVSVLIQSISLWLESNFIELFMKDNLITLLLALMAINTTTVSVIMTKLRELSNDNGLDFSRTINSTKESIIEQVILLVIAFFVLIVQSSTLLANKWSGITIVTNVLLITTFLYAVHILYDTAQAVFVIANKENTLLNEKKHRKVKRGLTQD